MGRLVIRVDVDYYRDDGGIIGVANEVKTIDFESDAAFIVEDVLKSFVKRLVGLAKAPEG